MNVELQNTQIRTLLAEKRVRVIRFLTRTVEAEQTESATKSTTSTLGWVLNTFQWPVKLWDVPLDSALTKQQKRFPLMVWKTWKWFLKREHVFRIELINSFRALIAAFLSAFIVFSGSSLRPSFFPEFEREQNICLQKMGADRFHKFFVLQRNKLLLSTKFWTVKSTC